MQDYKDVSGVRSNYFKESHQFESGYDSKYLREFVCKYSNKLSYADVSNLVQDISGFKVLTSQHANNLVKAVSEEVLSWQSSDLGGTQLVIPFLSEVDLYDACGEEILLLEDAIGVKSQKQERNDAYVKGKKRYKLI